MIKKYISCIYVGLAVMLTPCMLWAGDTNIKVNVDTKGIADEEIKLKDHDLKTKEYLEQKEKAEKVKQSDEYCALGDMYYSRGEIGKAAEYYEKAIAANENNVKAHESLLKVEKDIDKQESMIGGHYQKASNYLRMGLTDKAVDELVMELKANPGNEAARIMLNDIEARKSSK